MSYELTTVKLSTINYLITSISSGWMVAMATAMTP